MTECPDCGHRSTDEAGTVCDQCHRGILVDLGAEVMWIIDTDSSSFSWRVIAHTKGECMREFARMWNDWCRKTGADPYYWGSKGDKWSDVEPMPFVIGKGYMDREIYR